MFDILHVFCNGLSTLLRIGKILVMDHDSSAGGREAYVFSIVVHVARDVVVVERNCTSVGETNPIIALRRN